MPAITSPTRPPAARPLLPPGSRIAVVGPSGIHEPARLQAGMDLIASWGLLPVPAPHLGARHRYAAGTREQRLSDLRWALSSDQVDGLWFARGGYGTVHLLAQALPALRDDRPILGFSDATALFCGLAGTGRGTLVHGPVLHSLADLVDADSQQALRRLLLEGVWPELPGQHLLGPRRTAQGPLVGGNLCVLASLCGTPWAPRARGSLLLLEDIGEPPYKIDRLFTQLVLSGALEGVVGVALGSFTGCAAPEAAGWSLEQVLAELLEPLGVPVVAGLPVGHGPQNRPWRHGGVYRMDPSGLSAVGPGHA